MGLLALVGAETKALVRSAVPRDLFARVGTQANQYGGPMLQLDPNGWPTAQNTSQALDYDKLMGDPLQNGVVAACVSAIARATRSAPLLLEQKVAKGWEVVEDHECLEPLRAPNEDHSDADIWGLTSGFKAIRGQAFWLILPDASGRPREIYVWNPNLVEVLGEQNKFISGYRLKRETGAIISPDYSKEQVIHFRDLPDFHNARLGWNSLLTGRTQISGDNLSSTYSASILFNAGVVSLLVGLREATGATTVTPEQFQKVLTHIRNANRERAGGVEGINLPLEVHKLAYSPDEMAIDKLIEYYERRICSAMGVSQRVCGLGADPTYNNLAEALNDFWERRIVPDRDSDAATLNRQWLPLWGMDSTEWRFRFDYSNVPALQENKDELHKRVREDYKAGGMDLKQYRVLVGYATDNDTYEKQFEGVFYSPPKGKTVGDEDETMNDEKEVKAATSKPVKLEPWTDAELDEMSTITEGDLKETLAKATPAARALLTAKKEDEG